MPFDAIAAADLPAVGGKGANLGELTRAGLPVPPGFCVTTRAWRAHIEGHAAFTALLDELDGLDADDLDGVRALGSRIRAALVERPMPEAVAEAALAAWRAIGAAHAYAVRSSATAEDLPTASFAGQQDTYLNVIGEAALLDRIRACWASLYTDRAILYRARNGVAHRQVGLSVVVQRQIRPQTSGILFTADPVTGHRGHTSVDAGFGLGEALVSGLVDADLYVVDSKTGREISTRIGDKKLAIEWVDGGGTRTVELPDEKRSARVLGEAELARLVRLGRDIEAHYGCPQDIEWCFADGELFVVQARPITSLSPLPAPPSPGPGAKVYVCFNHMQVMTDAMPPLSVDLFRRLLPVRGPAGAGPSPWAAGAGGRVYLDVAPLLRRWPTRRALFAALGQIDPLIRAGVQALAARPGFADGPAARWGAIARFLSPKIRAVIAGLLWRDPVVWKGETIDWLEARVADRIARLDAAETADGIRQAVIEVAEELLGPLFDRVMPLVLCGLGAGRLLGRLAGPAHADDAEALTRGLAGNVTTDMDLAVGDLADLARGRPALVEALRAGDFERSALAALDGGPAFVAGLDAFLDRYGARAPSEIDMSRPRWRETPASILQAVAGNLAHAEPGAHRSHHARLAAEAEAAGERLVAAASRGLLTPARRWWARRLLRRQRTLAGLREHPKFAMVRVFDAMRRALLRLGALRAAAGELERAEHVWLLTLDELARPGDLRPLVERARLAFEHHQKLPPPRVMAETGEIPPSHIESDAPAGTLVGSPASAGVVEGVARVVRDPQRETLHKGEILVAPFTDPGWTPLFINAAGLVMEVGGRMTHGSVVAREYGLPAVVGLPGATTALRTGMRVRVDGERGWVTILDSPAADGEQSP